MSYSGRSTDEIYDDIINHVGLDFEVATEYWEFLEQHPSFFTTGFDDLREGVLFEDIVNLFQEPEQQVQQYIPEDFGDRGQFNIGCDYKGIKTIVEKENNNIFVPSSDYCMIKCYNKFFELINSDYRISTKFFSPYAPSLKKLQETILGVMIKCESGCKVNPKSYPGCSCTNACKKLKREKLKQYNLPQIYKIWYDKDKQKVKYEMLSKTKMTRKDYFIGLCHIGGNEYHAVLLKTLKFTKDDITFDMKMDRDLRCEFTMNKRPLYPDTPSIVVSYDIETYTQNDTIKRKNSEDFVKRLRPYALGYSIIDLKEMKVIHEYKEIIIKNKEDNLFNRFFEELSTYPYPSMQVFAHNGGKFDNIYAKEATNVKFNKTITKGGQIKQLTVEYGEGEDKKTYKMKDTLPFVLQSLKVACKMFNTSVKKLDFDIVDKSYEWYEEHKDSDDPKTNWRQYLKNDVESLADLMMKIEQAYNKFGTSILWSTGLAGLAYHMMNSYCLGMRKLYVPKDPSMVAFCRASIYGGRVLQWKRFYQMEELVDGAPSEGMISIDMNSLYPSAMWMGSFPYGEPRIMEKCGLDEFNKYPHYIVNATIKIPNIRYAYHPYKTDDGMLIYPSNCIIKGVYNDVDLREMMKDGYEVLNIEKGIYWNQSKRIFTNFINQLYDERNNYKKLGEDHPEYPLEYVIKIILNSTYGKFNETVRQMNIFKDLEDLQFKTNHGKIEREIPLSNGQKEVIISLKRIMISKPSYIGGYVTAYSRAIVNEIIRTVGVENIYYSDTDSIYLEKRILTEKNLPCSSRLGGFKNDYGDSMVIRKAIFLDMKRYYLEFEDRKFNPPKITYKAKFNGLAFRQLETISDFIDEEVDYKNMDDKEKMKLTEKMYLHLLDNYNKRIESPYNMINYDRILSREESIVQNEQLIKENKKKQLEWEKEYIKDMKMMTEFWNRGKTEVMIQKKVLCFQIDPWKRGQWINGEYYAVGYDLSKEDIKNKYEGRIGEIKEQCEKDKLVTYSLFEDKENGNMDMKCYRPLIADKDMKIIEEARDKIMYMHDNDKFKSNLYVAYEQVDIIKDGKNDILYTNEKVFYIDKNDDNIGFEVNGFGRLNKFEYESLDKIPYYKQENGNIVVKYYKLFPLIMLKGTDENIKKYGSNFITEEDVKYLISKIRSLNRK